MPNKNWKAGPVPSKQGNYLVETEERDKPFLALWAALPPPQKGKAWWEYVSEDPTKDKQPKLLSETVVRHALASAAEVSSHLARELTRQEKIEAAYTHYTKTFSFSRERARSTPPPSRQVKPGDRVEVGNLRDPIVAAVKENGAVVVIEHGGALYKEKNPQEGSAFTAFEWTSTYPLMEKMPEPITQPDRLYDSFRNMHVESLLHEALGGFDDAPDYQRGYAWTDADKQKFLTSWIEGKDIGRIVLVKRQYPLRPQVLDGKQRISTMLSFYRSELAWGNTFFHELNRRDRHRLVDRVMPTAYLDDSKMSRVELLEAFLNVNVAGVPQTEEHLAHVRALLEEARNAQEQNAASPDVATLQDSSALLP